MDILKVVIPKGQMPESCWRCIFGKVGHTAWICQLSFCNIKQTDFYRKRRWDCPLEESEDV